MPSILQSSRGRSPGLLPFIAVQPHGLRSVVMPGSLLFHAVVLRMSLARCQEEKLPYGSESIFGALFGQHEQSLSTSMPIQCASLLREPIRGMSDGTDHTNRSISIYHYWIRDSFCVVQPALSSRIWVERKEEVCPGYGSTCQGITTVSYW